MSEVRYDVEQLLREGNTVQFPIRGWSMYPFLSDGDTVTVEPVGTRTLNVNDAVLYRRIDGPLVLHRIMKIDEKGFYMCGDNQTEIEGPLSASQILGILTQYRHNKKERSVSSASYQIATSGWRILRPVRPLISKSIHALKSFLH